MAEDIKQTINEDIDPDDIVFDDDADMPQPETKQYTQVLKTTDKFMELFYEAVGKMKYTTVLSNNQGNQLKLIDMVRFVEAKKSTGMTPAEMNTILGFISNAEFMYVRPLMEVVEDNSRQKELWTIES